MVMHLAGIVLKFVAIVGWFFALTMLICGMYFGLRMGTDLKDRADGPPVTIPLFVSDDELRTPEGRRWRDKFHLFITLFFLTIPLEALAMHFHHKYWPDL